MKPELRKLLQNYGDRSSSWVSAYPHFEGFQNDSGNGTIRYHATQKTWVAAAEPLSSTESRADFFKKFVNEAESQNKKSLMLPISETLATELKSKGSNVFPVGAEPVFNLEKFFNATPDPLYRFPIARSLHLKGARVEMRKYEDCSIEERLHMADLFKAWKKDKGDRRMQFLSTVAPFECAGDKTYFLLFYRGKLEAFLTALPVKPRNAVYFADWIRPSKSRPGSMDLLLIEAMRILKSKGISEARLGLCPCARLEPADFKGVRGKLLGLFLRLSFRFGSYPYSLQGLYGFKSKLEPTSWEKLYAATPKKVGPWIFNAVYETHFGKTVVQSLGLALARQISHGVQIKEAPKTLKEWILRSRFTIGIGLFMSVIHALRMLTPVGQSFYTQGGFIGSGFKWLGFLSGPFLHDHNYHFAGDLSTFLIIGSVCEVFFGSGLMLLLTALGFWATNPLTVVALSHITPGILFERDYGSSNAIYAFAGAIAACTLRPAWIMLPFLANGVAVCVGKGSVLAMHHWVGLFLGFGLIRIIQRFSRN